MSYLSAVEMSHSRYKALHKCPVWFIHLSDLDEMPATSPTNPKWPRMETGYTKLTEQSSEYNANDERLLRKHDQRPGSTVIRSLYV